MGITVYHHRVGFFNIDQSSPTIVGTMSGVPVAEGEMVKADIRVNDVDWPVGGATCQATVGGDVTVWASPAVNTSVLGPVTVTGMWRADANGTVNVNLQCSIPSQAAFVEGDMYVSVLPAAGPVPG